MHILKKNILSTSHPFICLDCDHKAGDSQSPRPAHVCAQKPRQKGAEYCTFCLWLQNKTIKSSLVFQGAIHCQIKDKYNPIYCLVSAWHGSLVLCHGSSHHSGSGNSCRHISKISAANKAPAFPRYIFVIVSHEPTYLFPVA